LRWFYKVLHFFIILSIFFYKTFLSHNVPADTALLREVLNAAAQRIDFFFAPSNKKPAAEPPAKVSGQAA
jgi:hypothetical protein